METLASNNNQEISYSDFIAAASDKSKVLSSENLRYVFSLFDTDNSGDISLDELRAVFNDKNTQMYSDEMLKGIIKEFDIDGNNRISFAEFVDFMGTVILLKHTPSLLKNYSVPIEDMKMSFKNNTSIGSLVMNKRAFSTFD